VNVHINERLYKQETSAVPSCYISYCVGCVAV